MSLRREVPCRIRHRVDGHELLFRLWLMMLSAFTTLVFLSMFTLLFTGCGRHGGAPCAPQPAMMGAGTSTTGPQCRVLR